MSRIKKKEIIETKNFDEFFEELNDIANFKNFGQKEEEITNADGSRNWEANILLDNVKRLEQENERLKEENKLIRQLHKDLSDKLFEFQKIEDALQEIKAIAEKTIDTYYPDYYDEGFEEDIVTEFAKQVLDLITKAEEE